MPGYLKIGDIKGESVVDTEALSVTACTRDEAGFKIDALTNGDTYVGSYREDGANRFTTGGGGDSLTDAGLGITRSIKAQMF